MRAARTVAPRMTASRAAAVTVAGGVLIVIGFAFDASPLLVVASALAATGLAAPAWVWVTARSASVRRVIAEGPVTEDQPVQARIEVRRGLLGLPAAELVDPFVHGRLGVTGPLSAVLGERTARLSVTTRFPRRGLLTLAATALIVSDPLDLARVRVVSSAPAQQLLVLPRTEPVRWLGDRRGRRVAPADGRSPSDALAAVDLDGLRPYRPGTSASRIHWPAVARGAGLIERRLQADGDARPLVVLDARTAPDGDPALLDAAVRAAASLVLELARGGGCGLLLSGERRPTMIDRALVNWPAAHARLALVQGGPGLRPPVLGAGAGRSGPLVYVTAEPMARLATMLGGRTRGLIVLVAPTATLDPSPPAPAAVRTASTALFEVAGCRGIVLGSARRPAAATGSGALTPDPAAA